MTHLMVAAAVLGLAGSVIADTWTVDDDGPADFDSIQNAIDAASEGDEILVYPGTYSGFAVQKPVTVVGVALDDTYPFIDGVACLPVSNGGIVDGFEVRFSGSCSPSGYGFTDRGFVSDVSGTTGWVRNCIGRDGGANAWWANLEVTDCQFYGNFETPAFHLRQGGAGGTLTVSNSLICGTSGCYPGGGMANTFNDQCIPFINCIIVHPCHEEACLIDCDTFEDCPADCNANGDPDQWDIESGESSDFDGNEIPDECECLSDLSGDGQVDINDLLSVVATFGSTGPLGDVNYDGTVDINDLLLVMGAWGPCP